jgi:hypothetical protein
MLLSLSLPLSCLSSHRNGKVKFGGVEDDMMVVTRTNDVVVDWF